MGRIQVIRSNPHLGREGRVFFTEDGVMTAYLYEGESLLVETNQVTPKKGFQEADFDRYQFSKDCYSSGGVTVGDDPMMCKTLFERNGSYFVEEDDGEHHIDASLLPGIAFVQDCFELDGYPDMPSKSGANIWNGEMPPCFHVETKEIGGKSVFGVNYDRPITDIEERDLPDAQEKSEQSSGNSTGKLFALGAVLVAGIVIGHFTSPDFCTKDSSSR